ncbi:MAG: hypothetical protein IJW06_01045 [Clostridia bacterium]|nr:hypothetical protein [Clostridia bacterium]
MNKRLLGFVTFLLIMATVCNLGILAAPSVVENTDSALESTSTVEKDYNLTNTALQTELSVAADFSSGLGTEDFPYIIKTSRELALFAKVINEQKDGFVNAYYALDADIDLGGAFLVPIGKSDKTPFSGNFDGRGYSVSNYKIALDNYMGLFGYVCNGTIKNLRVSDFVIDVSPSYTASDSAVYAGGVAGYIYSTKGESNVSNVFVENGTININGKAENLYAGNIVGYAYSFLAGKVSISDCYTSGNITAANSTGYNYLGGIAGELYTGSGSLSQIIRCYSVGTIDSDCYHSSRAGGLVGYLYSYGSAYAPPSTAGLLASDVDIMIRNSFAVMSVYSHSTRYNAKAGRVVGECNTHADVNNIFYPGDADVTLEAITDNTNKKAQIDTTGTAVSDSDLKSSNYLSSSLGFDFEGVWGISESLNNGYPYLLCVESEKTASQSVDIYLGEKASEDNIRYYEFGGFQYALPERSDNYLKIIPLEDMLIEIVEKQSADSIYAVSTKYYYVNSQTLTYTELSGLSSYMGNSAEATIRAKDPLGIRFTSGISTNAKNEEDAFVIDEYGFIVGVQSLIDKTGSQLNFDFRNYVTGVAYSKKDDVDLVFDSSNDNNCVFTGVLKNVPQDNYTTVVTSKNYTKITVNGKAFTVYGEPVSTSMYENAKSLINSTTISDTQRAVLQGIIDIVDGN